jgi:hypothetical protein
MLMLIPEGVAEISQIFLRDTHVLPKLVSYEEHCRRDNYFRNPIVKRIVDTKKRQNIHVCVCALLGVFMYNSDYIPKEVCKFVLHTYIHT